MRSKESKREKEKSMKECSTHPVLQMMAFVPLEKEVSHFRGHLDGYFYCFRVMCLVRRGSVCLESWHSERLRQEDDRFKPVWTI